MPAVFLAFGLFMSCEVVTCSKVPTADKLKGCRKHAQRKLELGACGIGEEESGSENVAAKQIVLPFLSKNQTIQHVGLFGNSWKMEDDLPDIYRELEKRQDR